MQQRAGVMTRRRGHALQRRCRDLYGEEEGEDERDWSRDRVWKRREAGAEVSIRASARDGAIPDTSAAV